MLRLPEFNYSQPRSLKQATRALVDLGPEGGDGGGTVVAQGTPEDVAKVERSYTGQYLKKVL